MTWSPEYSPEGLILKVQLQSFGHLMWRTDSYEKTQMLGDWRREEKGTTEDEMVGWHHRLNGHEFEQAPGFSDGQGRLACCAPWGRKESDTTERLDELNGRVMQLAFWMMTTGWYVKGSFTYSPCSLKTMSLFATNEKESSFFPPSWRHTCTLWSRTTSSKLRCGSNLCVTRNKSWEMWCVIQDAGGLYDAILTLMDRSFSEIIM